MPLFRMNLELTNNCNFRCRTCPHSVYGQPAPSGGQAFNRPKGFVSDELVALIDKNARRYAASVTLGFFGEQTMHPKFDQIVERLSRNRPYKLVLFTNWSLVTAEKMETLKPFDNIRISIDGSTPELFHAMRPGKIVDLDGKLALDGYGTFISKLEHWLALEDGRPPTHLIFTTSSGNKHDRDTFLAEWQPKLAPRDSIVTKRVITYGGVMTDSELRENDCEVLDEKRFTIAWNGDCSPCNLDVNIGLHVGNLLEQKSVLKIFKGPRFAQVVAAIRRREGVCATCVDANNHTATVLHPGTRGQLAGSVPA